jgi:hypothetical protein
MKVIILLLCLISSIIYGQQFSKIEDSLIVYNLRLNSNCDTSTLLLKQINDFPQTYEYLSDNGYCFTISPASINITISFSFISNISGNIIINSGYSILNCTNTTFTSILLYDNTLCELAGEGFVFQVIDGHQYTWILNAETSGQFCQGFSTICPYWIGLNPLFIDLKVLEAAVVGNSVVISWITLSESNSHYFTLLKSSGFNDFIPIGKVNASGYSNNELSYSFTDDQPYTGVSYYKLVETDLNGYSTEFPVISVAYTNSSKYKVYDIMGNPSSITTNGLKIIVYENGNHTYKYINN